MRDSSGQSSRLVISGTRTDGPRHYTLTRKSAWRDYRRSSLARSGQDVERVVHLLEEIASRLVDQLPEPRHVDTDQCAAALANCAADDHRVHVAHVGPLDDSA